jgi:DNA-binding MarR family transcriptional regulator
MLPDGDMTVRQLILLLAVNDESGPHTVRGLATRFPMAKSDASRALDRLEQAGLIKRSPDLLDRRSVAIHATSAGRALVKKIENFAMNP